MKTILSLGAGVQSTTVLLMSCKGELPKIDLAIFADTGWEPRRVYEHLAWLEKEAEVHGIPVVRVSNGNIRKDSVEAQANGTENKTGRWASLPYHTKGDDGSRGLVRRQCTSEYKIAPVEGYIRREVLGLKPRQHAPKVHTVDHWFGISADEIQRMRISQNKWQRFVYPLVGMPEAMLPYPHKRHDCKQWLNRNYPGIDVPRSACIGCPFRSNKEWRDIKSRPDEWADAVEVDRMIRDSGGMRGKVYLHRDCVPLDEVDLRSASDKGQPSLFDDECLGMCGV